MVLHVLAWDARMVLVDLHVLVAWDARMVPVDLAYVIFIDFLALGVVGFCFCC